VQFYKVFTMTTCFALGCNHKGAKCHLFRFSRDEDIRQKWISLCGLVSSIAVGVGCWSGVALSLLVHTRGLHGPGRARRPGRRRARRPGPYILCKKTSRAESLRGRADFPQTYIFNYYCSVITSHNMQLSIMFIIYYF